MVRCRLIPAVLLAVYFSTLLGCGGKDTGTTSNDTSVQQTLPKGVKPIKGKGPPVD